MNTIRIGSILAVVIPLACAIVLGMMCLQQYKRREMATNDELAARQNFDSLDLMSRSVDIEPLTSKKIALEATPDEQAEFLTQLRINAQGAGVKLTQYQNMGPVVANPGLNGAPNQPPAQPSNYTPVASTLTVQGPFEGVRGFAYSLLRSNRLMNMNGVTWKRDPEGTTTTLSLTLIRYVTAPFTKATTTVASVEPASVGGGIR